MEPLKPPRRPTGVGLPGSPALPARGLRAMRAPRAALPAKETSASLSCASSAAPSLSGLARARFMLRKYWPQRCRPASFLSLFSLARRFWNQTCGEARVSAGARGAGRPGPRR